MRTVYILQELERRYTLFEEVSRAETTKMQI